jgi:predicted DsbA family dithiol-disulfide isomerase
METASVTIYSDYVCPYCYIGAARVEKLQQEYNPSIVWKSFELHPEAPEGGIPSSMFYQNNPNLKRISENARRLAADAELQFGTHVIYSNSRLALELGEYAEKEGKGEAFRKTLFDAYFQHIRDIGDKTVLLEIAERIDISRHAAEECLIERTMKSLVDAQIREARKYGITGVPTFIIGRYMVVGAQPYEVIKRAFETVLEENNASVQGS